MRKEIKNLKRSARKSRKCSKKQKRYDSSSGGNSSDSEYDDECYDYGTLLSYIKENSSSDKNKTSYVKSMHSTSNKITNNNAKPIKSVYGSSYRQQFLVTKGIGV